VRSFRARASLLRREHFLVASCTSVRPSSFSLFLSRTLLTRSLPSPSSHCHALLLLFAGLETIPFKGRINEASAHSLSDSLREAGFELGRLKTGTPPRLAKDSIKYEGLGEQKGDMPAKPFSFLTDKVANEVRFFTLPQPSLREERLNFLSSLFFLSLVLISSLQDNQVSCYQTATNAASHAIVKENIHRSVHVRETVKGPRYCPSIESKVLRFGDKLSHTVWLEPEGYDSSASPFPPFLHLLSPPSSLP
jgi:tRNA uridine 5-carboxymethylaminomethyl modification enzyme